jgi:thioredoxin-related protein
MTQLVIIYYLLRFFNFIIIIIGKRIGLYFDGLNVDPREVAALVPKYKEILDAGHAFEIIFVSEDINKENALRFYEQMPWLMLSYSVVAEVKKALYRRFKVRGYPALVLLEKDGSMITNSGRFSIYEQDFPDWGEYDEES